MPTQDVAKRDGVENPKNYNLINFKYGKFDALKTARVNRSRPLNNFHTEFALLEKTNMLLLFAAKEYVIRGSNFTISAELF